MNRCVKCGACSVVCPVYQVSGRETHTARGKHHLMEVMGHGEIGPFYETLFSQCLLCGRCNEVCRREIDTPLAVVRARAGFSACYGEHGYQKFLARKILEHPSLLHGLTSLGGRVAERLGRVLPAESGLRLKLGLLRPDDEGSGHSQPAPDPAPLLPAPKGPTLIYYPGCVSTYLYPSIADGSCSLVSRGGCHAVIPEGLGCCGLAAWAAGDLAGAKRLARQNIEVLECLQGEIVVSCGSCWYQLRRYGRLFEDPAWQERGQRLAERVVMLSRFLARHPVLQEGQRWQGGKKTRVFYHDPCHLLHEERLVDAPREVLARLPGVEIVELEGGSRCCGHGGLFSLGAPELSEAIRERLISAILQLRPDWITTSCSGCLMQLRMGVEQAGSRVKVLDLSELLCKLSG